MCLPSPFPCQNKLVRLKGKHSVQTTHASSRLHRNIVQLCTSITEPFHIITHTHHNFRIIGYIHHNFRKPKKIWKPLKLGRAMSPCRMYDFASQFPVVHQLVWSRSLQRENGREIVGETHLYSSRSFTLVTYFFLNSILFFSSKEKGLPFRMKVGGGRRNHRRFKFDHAYFLFHFTKNLGRALPPLIWTVPKMMAWLPVLHSCLDDLLHHLFSFLL